MGGYFSQFFRILYPLLIDSAFFGVIFLSGFLIRKNKKIFQPFSFFFALIFLSDIMVLQIIPLDMTVATGGFISLLPDYWNDSCSLHVN